MAGVFVGGDGRLEKRHGELGVGGWAPPFLPPPYPVILHLQMYLSIIIQFFLEEEICLAPDVQFLPSLPKIHYSIVKYVTCHWNGNQAEIGENINTPMALCENEHCEVKSKGGCNAEPRYQFLIFVSFICCNLNVISPMTACITTFFTGRDIERIVYKREAPLM